MENAQEDLYAILGLGPALEVGIKATAEAIRKAYRAKALVLHPDKRPDNPLAAAEFQSLQKAYDVLSDEQARKAYDDLLNVRKARLEKEKKVDAKRRKMMDDLKKREAEFEARCKERDEEEDAFQRLQAEIARIRAKKGQKAGPSQPEKAADKPATSQKSANSSADQSRDLTKILKVSWLSTENGGNEYNAVSLKEIFTEFGQVEDVVINMKKSTSKRASALVVMSSRDQVIAATQHQCGNFSNPLLVVPLVPQAAGASGSSFSAHSPAVVEKVSSSATTLVGNAYHDYEDSILKKMMRKKAEKLK